MKMESITGEPLDANELSGRLLGGRVPPCMSGFASSMLRFSHLNEVYHQAERRILENAGDESIFEATLEALGSRLEVSDQDLDRIPEKGPLL
ncbi:MAG: hypothetical protein AAEJ57_07000, partial [Opitutales bacterium]